MMMLALWILTAAAAKPDVSADSGEPLVCETPDEVMAGQPLVLHCAARSQDDRPVVVLVQQRPKSWMKPTLQVCSHPGSPVARAPVVRARGNVTRRPAGRPGNGRRSPPDRWWLRFVRS